MLRCPHKGLWTRRGRIWLRGLKVEQILKARIARLIEELEFLIGQITALEKQLNGLAAEQPAVAAAELAFNAPFLTWALSAARLNWQSGNRFHIYLIAYGLFRFAHEFARSDVSRRGPVTGYHFLAALIFVFGPVRYVQRRRAGIVVSGVMTDKTCVSAE